MKLNITLEDDRNLYDEMYAKIGKPIHESLAGNPDYIESNIVLNLDMEHEPICNLVVGINGCKDKEYVRSKLKNAVDLFIDNI